MSILPLFVSFFFSRKIGIFRRNRHQELLLELLHNRQLAKVHGVAWPVTFRHLMGPSHHGTTSAAFRFAFSFPLLPGVIFFIERKGIFLKDGIESTILGNHKSIYEYMLDV